MAEYQVHVTCENDILIMEYRNEPKISEISSEFKSGELLLYEKTPFVQDSVFDYELKLVAKIIV